MSARGILAVLALAATPVLTGCAGDTDNADSVGVTHATLHAHGHTNNGPAKWWWEYGTRRATVAAGGAKKTPTRGPASSASDVNLSEAVTGLGSDQTYYFRACGQDTKAGSAATCGAIREFTTLGGQSTLGRFSGTHDVLLVGSTATARNLGIRTDGATGALELNDSPVSPQTDPPSGSEIVSSSPCFTFPDTPASASCSTSGITRVVARLGPNDDIVDASRLIGLPVALVGSTGNDQITGSDQDDMLYGDEGNDTIRGNGGDDTIFGADGNDVIHTGTGQDTVNCGPGNDTVYYSGGVSYDSSCETVQSEPSAARSASHR